MKANNTALLGLVLPGSFLMASNAVASPACSVNCALVQLSKDKAKAATLNGYKEWRKYHLVTSMQDGDPLYYPMPNGSILNRETWGISKAHFANKENNKRTKRAIDFLRSREKSAFFFNQHSFLAFRGAACQSDCAGTKSGYEYAVAKKAINDDDCRGTSESFVEGCKIFVREYEVFGEDWL